MWSCGLDRPDLSYFHACLSCLKRKTKQKKPNGLGQKKKKKNEKKRKETKAETFKHLSAMSMVEPFQICASYPTALGPQQKACQQILFTTLEEKPSCFFFFSLLQRRVCKEGPSGWASKAHCLVLLITPLFVLIMAASRMFLFRNTILPHQTHSSTAQM